MSAYHYILEIALILVSTKLLGLVAKKLQMPQVVGALLAGILIGPCVLGLVEESEFIVKLSEIGVIFLMFIAGIETDIDELKKQGKASFVIALLGVIVPLVVGLAITYGFKDLIGIDSQNTDVFLQSVFVGVILTATSVSITVETLREMGKITSKVGNAILGAAIIDDVLGIVALSIVTSFAGSSVSIVTVLFKIFMYFIFAGIVGFSFYKLFKMWFAKSKIFEQQHVIAVTALCLIMAYISEEFFGIANITGAFVTGLIISAVHDEKEDIMGILDDVSFAFLSPIFFASIGLKLVLPQMSTGLVLYALVLSIAAILTKVVGCGIGAKIFKFNTKESIQIGSGMVSRGEVALIVANKGVALNIISNVIFAPILIVVIITTVISPVLLKLAFKEKDTPNGSNLEPQKTAADN